MSELAVLNTQGDLKISWDPNVDAEVLEAKRAIKELRDKGYSFFVEVDDEAVPEGGEVSFRRVDNPVEAVDAPKRPGRPRKAVATPPMRGG